MDILTPEQRRKAMAHNRGRTGPERTLASTLWRQGIRYLTAQGYRSLTGRRLQGSPDLVFSRQRVAIFVDGCFWHGCSKCDKLSEVRSEFWIEKIRANRSRDQRVTTALQEDGWVVLRIPEHDLLTKASLAEVAKRVASLLSQQAGPRRTFS